MFTRNVRVTLAKSRQTIFTGGWDNGRGTRGDSMRGVKNECESKYELCVMHCVISDFKMHRPRSFDRFASVNSYLIGVFMKRGLTEIAIQHQLFVQQYNSRSKVIEAVNSISL